MHILNLRDIRAMKTVHHSVALLLLLTAVVSGQQHKGMVVGVLFSSTAPPYQQASEGFRTHLQEQNVPLLFHTRVVTQDTPEDIKVMLSGKKPDIVLALGARAAEFAQSTIDDIPVVFCMVFGADRYHSSNSTGVSLDIPARARLQRLKGILPKVKRVGFVTSPRSTDAGASLRDACSSLGLTPVHQEVQTQRRFTQALEAMAGKVDVFMMVPDPSIYLSATVDHLLRTGLDSGFPVVGLSSAYTKAGALLSFDCSYADLGRQAGVLALRIDAGESPGSIEPQTPEHIVVSLNLSVARRLGTDISPETAAEAAQVYGR